LIRAHFNGNDEKFKTMVLQIADYEAKKGYPANAEEIKNMIGPVKKSHYAQSLKMQNRLDILEERVTTENLIVSFEIENKIKRIIQEYKKKDLLEEKGLRNRAKLLLTGPSGTGKTMTASVIANELYLPLYIINFDRLLTKYGDESSMRLREVFSYIKKVRGVYLFDEFETILSDKNLEHDHGEMQKIVNAFLQHLEDRVFCSLIIVATGEPCFLKKSLFRCFDDVIEYRYPDEEQIMRLFRTKLYGKASNTIFSEDVYCHASGLNHEEIVNVCEDAIKDGILQEHVITKPHLIGFINDWKTYKKYKEV